MTSVSEVFDYVIVGGGTAGALLTKRLSEDGSSVCLLEAGPRDLNPFIHIPAGYIKNVYSKTLTWNFETEPGPGTAGPGIRRQTCLDLQGGDGPGRHAEATAGHRLRPS